MTGTFEITKIYVDIFPMIFSSILHKLRNHNNSKRDIKSIVSEINETTDQLSIKSSIDFGRLIDFM
jgi:hypothetical protein